VVTGKVSDFTSGIEHHYTMQGMYDTEWSAYDTLFDPEIVDSLKELETICANLRKK
jgi:hypothetical protein